MLIHHVTETDSSIGIGKSHGATRTPMPERATFARGLVEAEQALPAEHVPSVRRIRLVLADDQPIALADLEALFRQESQFLVLQQCGTGHDVVRAVTAHRPASCC